MSSISGGDDRPTAVEWTAVAVGVGVTLLLFGYVAWHAATGTPGGPPEATVVGTETTEDSAVLVSVAVYNPREEGLQSVTVSTDCSTESLTFTHVPTDGRRTGTVVCPPDAADPSASVRTWIDE